MDDETRQTTIQLKRPWLLALVAVPLVLQILLPNRVWIALSLAFGGALGLAYVWARQMASRVTISREQRYGWAHVGDLLEERFTLDNRSFLPVLWAEIDDRSDLPGYTARSVRGADGNQSIHWRSEGVCRQRGLFTLGPWTARFHDPFGFFEITVNHPESRSILVYPPVVHLPRLRLPRGAATGAGRTSRRALEVTANAAGVRDYAPGDSLNRIHWKTSARRDSLMVKTFDLEPSGDLWIVLDLDAAVQAGRDEESTAEYGVILAASLADRVLRQNRAVGLAVYGRSTWPDSAELGTLPTLVLPQKGKAQQWRILSALATVRAGGIWPLERVLVEMDHNLGRGMTLAVITPSCNPDWVAGLLSPMRRGVAPTVILLDPTTFGENAEGASPDATGSHVGVLAPRKARAGPQSAPLRRTVVRHEQELIFGEGEPSPAEALVGLLADLGVPSHRIAKGMPFDPIVEHEQIGRPEIRVLPGTGRVIRVER